MSVITRSSGWEARIDTPCLPDSAVTTSCPAWPRICPASSTTEAESSMTRIRAISTALPWRRARASGRRGPQGCLLHHRQLLRREHRVDVQDDDEILSPPAHAADE